VKESGTFEVMLGSVPLQDDEVLLLSVDGYFEQVLHSDDPDVTPDEANRLLYYRFRLVQGRWRHRYPAGE
jgi:hypothetical protein